MIKATRFAILIFVMMMSFALSVSAQDAKTIVTGISMVAGDLETIDPQKAETSSQIEVINQMFIGVTNQDVITGNSGLGIAESVEVSEDGLTYTYTLRQDIPWVRYNPDSGAVEQILGEDGAPLMVTAGDVLYGITRGLDPVTASPYSYVLAPYITNGIEFNAGEADAASLGVTVVDDYTLSINQPSGSGFSGSIYGLWISRPVLASAIEEGGDAWTEVGFIATNGPYTLKEWNHGTDLTIIKNPFWPGVEGIPQPAIDEVTFKFLDEAQQLAEYEAGNISAISAPAAELDRIKADSVLGAEYFNGSNPCTYYIGFDNTEEITGNVHVRRALSYAIDRESIVVNVTKGGQIPARWFGRVGLQAALLLDENAEEGLGFDPMKAQEEFALALEELGIASAAEFPVLTFAFGDTSLHNSIAQVVQQMWKETLGIEVQLDPRESTSYFSSISEDAPSIYRAGWCQDYGDVNNFLYDVFFSAASQNDTGFVNAEFDALVSEARLLTDVEARRALYVQAENILVRDQAAIAPIYFYTTNLLIKPEVERAVSVTGNEAYYLWNLK